MPSKYDQFQAGQKAGLCPLCGWKDGEGVKQCYYDEEVGPVVHQNSPDAYWRSLSPSQRSLEESYNSHHTYWRAEDLERMRAILSDLVHSEGDDFVIGICHYSKKRHPTEEAAVEAWLEDKAGLDKALAEGCVIRSIESHEYGSYTFAPGFKHENIEVQKPHECGGFAYFAGAYHIKCNKCACEIKMWEHGIDYDVG